MKKSLFGLVLCSIGMAACTNAELPPEKLESKSDIEGKRFVLVAHNGRAIKDNFELSFDEGSLSTKICNQINGQYKTNGEMINALLVSTKMACLDENVTALENDFNNILSNNGAKFSFDGDVLTMNAGDKSLEYKLQK